MVERVWLGLEMTVLGMGVVFLALIVLTLVMSSFKYLFAKKKPSEVRSSAENISKVSAEDDNLAVILAAAAYVYLEENTKSSGFNPKDQVDPLWKYHQLGGN